MALDFAAGCVGGCAGLIIGHPLDTVKVKLQTQDYKNPLYRGAWDCFSKILRTESVAGVYRGVSSPMAGIAVVNAIVFGVYGNMQRRLAEPDSLSSVFLAGAVAGLVQSVIASPVELVKTRVQTTNQYQGTWDCFCKTYKQEGVRGVFKGLGITGAREFLGYGLYFATYEALTKSSDTPVGTGAMLLAGGMSGTVSWVSTYPLDVVKSRYQADVHNYTSVTDCLRKSVREEGVKCLTRGLTPTIIRAFPTNAVTFTVVTWVFRLAEYDSGDIKQRVESFLETLWKNKSVLKHLDIIEGTSSTNVNVSRLLLSKEQMHLLTLDDLMTDKVGDDLAEDLTPEDLLKKENQLDRKLSSVDQNTLKSVIQQAELSNTNNAQADEKYTQVTS